MLKKIIIGVLLITVVGAGAAAIAYNMGNQDAAQAAATPDPLASNALHNTVPEQVTPEQPAQIEVSHQGDSVTQDMQGESWQATGTVATVDDYGFDLTLASGETVYIELGPPDYWQAQDIDLSEGQLVSVSGSTNEDMIHAATVTVADGQVLTLRTDAGQPMWSGGVENSNGQNGQQADGDQIPEPKTQVDEWVTLEGTLMSFQGGNMTMSTADGSLINFQTGQPRFFAEQGITFQVGDQISILGFYEGEQFMAGEITQLSTGLRVMLRDPNGRPLWAGPGNSNGSNGGNGNGGNGGNDGNQNGGNSQGNGGPQG